MKTSKRILSSVLAILMVFSVCSVGLTATAVDSTNGALLDEIVLEPTARPKVEFTCTEVTRVAAAVGSVEPGSTIVKATPSGVPELTGTYAAQAYAGETPAATKVTFKTTSTGISITGLSCSNETVVLSDMVYDSATGTYSVEIISGTANAGESITFTVDYKWTDGNTYQEKCVSYVEGIVTGGSHAYVQITYKPNSGTGSWYRGGAGASTRLLGKGVYYETPSDLTTSESSPYKSYGIYDVSSATSIDNVAAGYNTSFYSNDKEVKVTGTPRKEADISDFIEGTSTAHVYVDKSAATTLADLNLRLDANVTSLSDRNNDNPYTALDDVYVMEGAVTSAPEAYTNSTTAQSVLGYSVPAKADNGIKEKLSSGNGTQARLTVTGENKQYTNIFTYGFTGAVSGIVDGSTYTIINKYYSFFRPKNAYITASPYVPTTITFHVVDKSTLREVIDYVMSSDPDSPAIRNQKKGSNPQSWYYNSGFSAFQSSLVEALSCLNNPKALQDDINAKATALQKAYNNLILKKADYTEVDKYSEMAQEILDNASCYPTSDIAIVTEAMDMVKNNYNILYQGAVDTMASNLKRAVDLATPYSANYTEVYAAIAKAEKLDSTLYSTESWQYLQSKIQEVDYTLTMLEQDTVDNYAKNINNAIDSLAPLTASITNLKAAVAQANAIDRTLYINGSLLINPVKNAQAIIDSYEEEAWAIERQDEIDKAEQAILDTISGLVLRSADKTELYNAISATIPGNEKYYDQSLLSAYKALVAEGQAMYDDASLTYKDNQSEVDAKAAAIKSAYTTLMASYTIPVDTAGINKAIADAKAEIAKGIYEDDDALKALNSAISEAEELLKGEMTEDSQTAIDAAAAKINDAVTKLNKKPIDLSEFNKLSGEAAAVKAETISVTTYIDGALGSEDKAKYSSDAIAAIESKITAYVTEGLTIEDQTAVDTFVAGIRSEIAALEVLTYTEYLTAATNEYDAVADSSIYTEATWNAYKAAYDAAKALTNAAQADINTALTNLVNAKSALALSAYFGKAEGSTTVIDKEAGVIYGLSDEGLSDIEAYIEYAGGTVEYEESAYGFGTGTVVKFVVGGETLEKYTIVIFGDVNGDGVVDSFDYATLAGIVNGDIDVDEDSAVYKAADVFADGSVDAFDLAVLAAYTIGDAEITQTPDAIA